MTSTAFVPQNITSSNDSAGSPSVAASSTDPSSVAAGASSTAANENAPQINVGAHNASQSSVNSRASNMAAPMSANSNLTNGDHAKRPSVTISAAGASGQLPNGPSSATRPNISFGSMNASGSPALANSVPFHNQASTLMTPQSNPRILSPAGSPSPIPQPAASGGRPPTNFQSHGNGPTFGSMGGAGGETPNGVPGAAPLHRQPSQQSHADGNTPNMSYQQQQRPGFIPGQGRGGGGRTPSFNQGYNPQAPYSPGPGYRNMNNSRPGGHMGGQFQGQMLQPNSPHMHSRTPGPQGSQPGTPQMQHMHMGPGSMPYLQPSYQGYQQQLQGHNGQFGSQPPYDPNYAYYHNPYQMHPQYMQHPMQQQSQSPRPRPGASDFNPNQYNQQPSQMSRSPSQNPEHRPASAAPPQHSPAPAPSAQTPGPQPSKTPASSNFTIPQKKSKGIVIKNADGEIVSLASFNASQKPSTPAAAAAPSPSPAPTATEETPRAASAAPAEAKPTKSAEEIKAEFLASVKKDLDNEKADRDAKTKADSDATAAKEKEESDAKAAKAKEEADAKTAADEKAAKDKQEADQKAADQKVADEKAATEKAESDKKAADVAAEVAEADKVATANADKKAADVAAEVVEADKAATANIKAEAEKALSDKAASDKAASDKIEADKSAASEPSAEDAAAEKKRLEDEEMERMIAEMEAADREEEERNKAYEEKKAKEKAEREAREKANKLNPDDEMKRLEREAEAAEEAREKKKAAEEAGQGQVEESAEQKAEKESIFASLKKPTIGPGADAASAEETTTEDSADKASATAKPKSAGLKVETKPEPAQATSGMQALRTSRMLDLINEKVSYPDGTKAIEAGLSQAGKRAGKRYDMAFLLQFRPAYKEKPLLDWDQRVKDTMGDGDAKSARTPGPGGRAGSHRGGPPPAAFNPMGTFGQGPRTLPPGTSSADRFAASQGRGATMTNPLAGVAGRGGFPMGGGMPAQGRGMGAPSQSSRGAPSGGRNQSTRGGGGGRAPSRQDTMKQDKTMPLTAGMDLKAIEVTASGWKPTSVGNKSMAAAAGPDGHMAPDMVQRKVKAALNKMTPERFDKIADQILEISKQSKDETDGRTMRQVIQLTFDKACDEAHWASMYAKFCLRMLETISDDIKDASVVNKEGALVTGGGLFRKYLLNRCQEEFERGWTVNLPEKKEGESEEAQMLSDEYYIAEAAKRKGLGLIQFIGEVYKLRMLSIKIMHECFARLLAFEGLPDESAIESLVKLLRTVGGSMQAEELGPRLLDQYFSRIAEIMNMEGLPSRMHFMLLDVVDLRKAGWRSKDDAKGPKTIQEIRAEAAVAQENAERERLAQRGNRPAAGRGDARFGGGMPAPDYPRNQVAKDDLARLGNRRQASSAGGAARTLGPTSFGSRSNSGRPGMGPGASPLADSRASSRRQQDDKKDDGPTKSANAFDALLSLDNEGGESPTSSPTLTKAQPAASSAAPATDAATEGKAQEASGDADAAPADVAQANE